MKTLFTLIALVLLNVGNADAQLFFRPKKQTAVSAPVPEIFWAKFNEGSGSTWTSTVGPNGTNTSAWSTSTQSGSGAALLFTGTTNSYNGGTTSAVDYGSAATITVCAWIRPASTNGTKIVLESSTLSFDNAAWEILFDSNTFGALMGRGVGSQYRYMTCVPPPVNTWTHVAVVFDRSSTSGSITIYLNGVSQSLSTVNSNIGASGTFANFTLFTGCRAGNANFYDGRLDDVRIYNRQLTTDEITSIIADPQ